ncbi:MAG: bile acid:sodium symporter family protein [Robiginitomaculum sp.]|nr:bile acid:sodium symporter family protein [Robiginitomaculum sp.]
MDAEALNNITLDMGGPWEMVLAAMLALMMFAVALGLKPAQFAFFKSDPKHYFAGVLAQLVGLPLLTLGLVHVLNPIPSLALGMILVSCCPGGNISNIMTLFGRGNTALSVSMTATSSLAAAFITPVSILFWLSLYPPTRALLTTINFDVGAFLLQTLIILAIPILLGMVVAFKAPIFAAKVQKPLAISAVTVMMVMIIIGFYKYRALIPMAAALVVPLVVIHNACALALGYLSGLLTGADVPTRRALTFEVGIQNSALGFVILVTQLDGLGGAVVLTGLWGLWHLVGGWTMVGLFRYADKRKRRYVDV